MRTVFQSGDRLQRGFTTSVFSLLAGEVDVSRFMAKTAVDLAQCAAGTAAVLSPDSKNQLSWLELQNKLEAFNLFAHIDLELDLLRNGASLRELIARASCLGPYRSVWAMEGVGHWYAESDESAAARISLKAEAETLPASSLIPLHSGAGLSFAERCLETTTDRHTDAQVRTTLRRFVALCKEKSHAAYVGAAYEALGLVTRNLHPHLLPQIDQQLAEIDEELVSYFWHGVGRGLYFAPTNFLLLGENSRSLMLRVQQESPHETARLNTLSGLIWALVLVNIRHPQILETFIAANLDELDREIFAAALCSAVAIWHDSSPDKRELIALWRHRPADIRVTEFWNACVIEPSSRMVDQYYSTLRQAGLGCLFRHQSLSELFTA